VNSKTFEMSRLNQLPRNMDSDFRVYSSAQFSEAEGFRLSPVDNRRLSESSPSYAVAFETGCIMST
jgi:hypothetical protein